jgi:hypothetical protein
MFDSIDLLNADGRSFWQARPESTFVYINQCMEADLKLAAKNLRGSWSRRWSWRKRRGRRGRTRMARGSG